MTEFNKTPVRNNSQKKSGLAVQLITGAAAAVFALGCLWILGNMTSFSRTEAFPDAGRDLSAEYLLENNTVKSSALDGIYSIDLTYVIPDTQVIAPEPSAANFGTARSKEELVSAAEQAESYGLIKKDQLKFLREKTPWSTNAEARYYLDETIFSVSWKAEIGSRCANFTEVVIAHPSQFRRYFTDNTFSSGKRKTVSSMSKEVNAVVGMNGDFYEYRYAGILIYNGQIYRDDTVSLESCFVDDNGKLIFIRRNELTPQNLPQYVSDNNIRFSLSFGPILIDNGRLMNHLGQEYLVGQTTGLYARAAIGQYEDLHYLLCTVDGGTTSLGVYRDGATVLELAQIMETMECVNAYTLDGGQTATMTVNGETFNQVGHGSERPVSDFIYFATALPGGGGTEASE